MPVPVDDSRAESQTLRNTQGNQGGGDGDDTGLWDGTEHGIAVILEPTLPLPPTNFVAVEQAPELIDMREPVYPELARAAGIEGTVLVRVLVGEDGFVQRSLLLHGVLGLDEAALDAAGTTVFRPAQQQGRAVAVWVVIPIEFRLRP